MTKSNQLPKALRNAPKSKWLESAKRRQENEDWLDMSFEIALSAYSQLKADGKTNQWLADEMGVSAQYVGKLLKGKENLTLQTICKLEQVLGINLITLAKPTMAFTLHLDPKPTVANIGSLTMVNAGHEVEEHIEDYESYSVAG